MISNGVKEIISHSPEFLWYLGMPYSHENQFIKEQRYSQSLIASILLINKYNLFLFEPIAMCHQQAKLYDLPSDYSFWSSRNKKWLSSCDGLLVLPLDGWRDSIGLTAEIVHARQLNMPIYYVSENWMDYINEEKESGN